MRVAPSEWREMAKCDGRAGGRERARGTGLGFQMTAGEHTGGRGGGPSGGRVIVRLWTDRWSVNRAGGVNQAPAILFGLTNGANTSKAIGQPSSKSQPRLSYTAPQRIRSGEEGGGRREGCSMVSDAGIFVETISECAVLCLERK